MRSPMDLFFKLGAKVTKGDPQRKADFDYTFLWVIFVAFAAILIGNLRSFYYTHQVQYLGWALVMVGILWFQYFTLMAQREMRKIQKQSMENAQNPKEEPPKKEVEEDSVEDMLKEFDNGDTSNQSRDSKQSGE